jgi:hypothetical protein
MDYFGIQSTTTKAGVITLGVIDLGLTLANVITHAIVGETLSFYSIVLFSFTFIHLFLWSLMVVSALTSSDKYLAHLTTIVVAFAFTIDLILAVIRTVFPPPEQQGVVIFTLTIQWVYVALGVLSLAFMLSLNRAINVFRLNILRAISHKLKSNYLFNRLFMVTKTLARLRQGLTVLWVVDLSLFIALLMLYFLQVVRVAVTIPGVIVGISSLHLNLWIWLRAVAGTTDEDSTIEPGILKSDSAVLNLAIGLVSAALIIDIISMFFQGFAESISWVSLILVIAMGIVDVVIIIFLALIKSELAKMMDDAQRTEIVAKLSAKEPKPSYQSRKTEQATPLIEQDDVVLDHVDLTTYLTGFSRLKKA